MTPETPLQQKSALAAAPMKIHARVSHHPTLVRFLNSFVLSHGLSFSSSFLTRRVEGRGGRAFWGNGRKVVDVKGVGGTEVLPVLNREPLLRGGVHAEEGREAGERKGARKECVLRLLGKSDVGLCESMAAADAALLW